MPYPSTVDSGGAVPWYLAYEGNVFADVASGALTTNTTYLVGIWNPATVTPIKMRTHVASAPSGNLDMGIYDSSGNLLTHTGITTTVNNLNEVSLLTQVTLSPGTYYLALWVSAGDTYNRASVTSSSQAYGNFKIGTSVNGTGATNTTNGLLSTFSAMGGTSVASVYPVLQAAIQGGF